MRNRLKHFQALAGLFAFKTLKDGKGNELVVYRDSAIEDLTGFSDYADINDKTAFEALENHVHLLYGIKRKEFKPLIAIGNDLGKALLASLKFDFPYKKFVVYVTIDTGEDFIIRFHQKWEGETPYMNPEDLKKQQTTKVIMFHG